MRRFVCCMRLDALAVSMTPDALEKALERNDELLSGLREDCLRVWGCVVFMREPSSVRIWYNTDETVAHYGWIASRSLCGASLHAMATWRPTSTSNAVRADSVMIRGLPFLQLCCVWAEASAMEDTSHHGGRSFDEAIAGYVWLFGKGANQR